MDTGATMQLSDNYKDFIEKLDRIRPRCVEVGETYASPLYDASADSGKGT